MSDQVPDGWGKKSVKDLGTVITGTTPSTKHEYFWGGSIPFISPSDFKSTVYVRTTQRTVTEEGASQGRLLPEDSVLVTCIGSLGGISMNPIKSITNQQINAVVLNEENDPRFCYYLFLHNVDQLIRLAGITTIPIINKSTFEKIKILAPPLPEQKKIASILTSVDNVIEKTEAHINKLQDLKKGMMTELLTKGINHTEFKDGPVGRIPKSWEVKPLSSLVSPDRPITYGIVQTGDNISDGIPCVRVVDMTKQDLIVSEMIRTSLDINNQYKRTILKEGDLIFALRGEIGRVRLITKQLEGINLTRGIALISPNKSIAPNFLLWAIRSILVRKQILDNVNGSALQEIPLTNLRKVLIPIAPSAEQEKIYRVLDGISLAIYCRNAKLDRAKSLKKALMNDLLTGKKRVSTDN